MSPNTYSNGTVNHTAASGLITGSAHLTADFRSGFFAFEEPAMEAPRWVAAGSTCRCEAGVAGPAIVQRIAFRE